MDIFTYLRIWFAINNIQQKKFSEKYRIPNTTISETLNGTKKKVPEKFAKAFQKQFGFPVYDVYENIKLELGLKSSGTSVMEDYGEYEISQSEEKDLIEKLTLILRDSHPDHVHAVRNIINIFCGDKLWKENGSVEKRKKLIPRKGEPERRLKIHGYEETN